MEVVMKHGKPVSGVAIPHDRVQVDFVDAVSMARQEFADECDVNSIMARYEKTGVFPFNEAAAPRYLDCSEIPDFQTAQQVVIDANAAFMSLPAHVRREFENDAAKFVDYACDPENLGQMREWGLAPPEKAPDAPMRVEVVEKAAEPGSPPAVV